MVTWTFVKRTDTKQVDLARTSSGKLSFCQQGVTIDKQPLPYKVKKALTKAILLKR
ncbi:hypothetical protein KIN20_003509 [Parelaphostrongylus tenuis]|uniref:Uncharacterized protein n=1 Tax=Parelaphostrongylus tenuis TaxID=148309 RepID=A0AAD5QEF8_PARTN|nr:hypothetical protein KIN20_003509 [Parelaphostrongylus tenuis]